jgi:hypothetical protein
MFGDPMKVPVVDGFVAVTSLASDETLFRTIDTSDPSKTVRKAGSDKTLTISHEKVKGDVQRSMKRFDFLITSGEQTATLSAYCVLVRPGIATAEQAREALATLAASLLSITSIGSGSVSFQSDPEFDLTRFVDAEP